MVLYERYKERIVRYKKRRTAITIHGVHGLKGNYLRGIDSGLAQKLLKMLGVVVSENMLWDATVSDALDH